MPRHVQSDVQPNSMNMFTINAHTDSLTLGHCLSVKLKVSAQDIKNHPYDN